MHRRLGHANFNVVEMMQGMAKGLKLKPCKNFLDCNVCKVAKSKVPKICKESNRQILSPFQLVHADVIGPLVPSMGGAKNVLVLVDDHTRFSFCILMKNKAEVFDHFKGWVHIVERHYSQKVGQLQTDRVSEFMSGRFIIEKQVPILHFRMVWQNAGIESCKP